MTGWRTHGTDSADLARRIVDAHNPRRINPMSKRKTRKLKPAGKAAPRRKSRRAGTKPKLRVVQQPVSDREHAFSDLEAQIYDLNRAARIAFLMMMHDSENADDLGMFAVEQVERLALELQASFSLVCEGKAVRT